MSKRKHGHLEDKVLKIPKTDFPSLLPKTTKPSPGGTKNPPLLLLQLPSSLTVDDLIKTHFITEEDGEKCRLISEEKGLTFDLVKVETSNSYILVKDDGENDKPASNGSNSEEGNEKMARLLRENNTFFLECIESKVDLESEIQFILKDYTYPLIKQGVSVNELSSKLMHSKKQVQKALEKMHAFQLSGDNASYGMLSEEIEREVWFVIQGVLSEWSGGVDYAGKGVDLSQMVNEVLKQNDDEDQSGELFLEEAVVKHCLKKCSLEVVEGYAKLNVDYIAKILAHYIFNMQTAPWEQNKFMETWHNLMPGVGAMYEPSLNALKGIAITTKDISPMELEESAQGAAPDEEETILYLKYFPIQGLPTTQDGRFKALFKERERWKFEDLEPYLIDLVDKSSFKTTKELLAAFTRVAPKEENDDDSIDWYVSK